MTPVGTSPRIPSSRSATPYRTHDTVSQPRNVPQTDRAKRPDLSKPDGEWEPSTSLSLLTWGWTILHKRRLRRRRPLRWRFSKFNGVVACVVSCRSLVISSTTVLPRVWALVDYIWTTTQPWQRVAPERISKSDRYCVLPGEHLPRPPASDHSYANSPPCADSCGFQRAPQP